MKMAAKKKSAVHTESAAALRLEIEKLKARRVVSLRRFRDLRLRLVQANTQEFVQNLREALVELASRLHELFAGQLREWIDEIAREKAVPAKRSPQWLAAWLCERPHFWRLSQKARRWYAEMAEVPAAEVRAHVRARRAVRAHRRLLGYEHLLYMAKGDGVVDEVLRIIAADAGKTHASRRRSTGRNKRPRARRAPRSTP